jgi:hypothetical protein
MTACCHSDQSCDFGADLSIGYTQIHGEASLPRQAGPCWDSRDRPSSRGGCVPPCWAIPPTRRGDRPTCRTDSGRVATVVRHFGRGANRSTDRETTRVCTAKRATDSRPPRVQVPRQVRAEPGSQEIDADRAHIGRARCPRQDQHGCQSIPQRNRRASGCPSTHSGRTIPPQYVPHA